MRPWMWLLLSGAAVGCGEKESSDLDKDGIEDAEDCDPADASVYPGAAETCDGIDNDCDDVIDEEPDPANALTVYVDADGDSHGNPAFPLTLCETNDVPAGYVDNAADCDDLSAAALPGGTEVCDGLDNDCDGTADDNASDTSLWYFDGDGDSYGTGSSSTLACEAPASYVDNALDCDDSDADTNPDQSWYVDDDQDGYGNPEYRIEACGVQVGYAANNEDCDDGDEAVSPSGAEMCDGIDNNCDGDTDEDAAVDATIWYYDDDVDGYGDDASASPSCSDLSLSDPLWVLTGGDCDDADTAFNPSQIDVCADGLDSDCDGGVDNLCEQYIETAVDLLITSEGASNYLGTAIQTRGDFNGDGAIDLAAGAHYNSTESVAAGRAYVFFGPLTAGTAAATDADAIVTGEGSYDFVGYALALEGDVNADGYDDLLVGAYGYDEEVAGGDLQDNAGAAYVVYGPVTGAINVTEADGFIHGLIELDYLGHDALDNSTDFNADGNADVLVGAYLEDTGATGGGMIGIYFGPVEGERTTLDADVSVHGTATTAYVGYSAAPDDYDGDGVADLAYGEAGEDMVYLMAGPLSGTLTPSSAAATIEGASNSYAGSKVESGDFNADGHRDLAVGARGDDTLALDAGAVSVLYGPLAGTLTLAADADFVAYEDSSSDTLGTQSFSLVSADINLDGTDDLAIGSGENDALDDDAGAAFLFYGPLSGSGDANSNADAALLGAFPYGGMGWALDVGDLDGDGMPDVTIGQRTYGTSSSSINHGAVYTIFNGGF